MPPQVQILNNVFKRLEVYSPVIGSLYGVMYDGKVLIVGVGFEMRAVAKQAIWYDSTQQIYPTGIDCCGVFTVDNDAGNTEAPELKNKLKDITVTNNPLFLRKDLSSGNIQVYYSDGIHLKLCGYSEVSDAEFKEKFVYLHLLGMTRVIIPEVATHHQVTREMEKLSGRVAAGMLFKLGADTNKYLNKYSNYDHSTLGKLFHSVKKDKEYRFGMEVLKILAMFPQGPFVTEVSNVVKPHIFDYTISSEQHKEKNNILFLNLPIDALCIAHKDRNMDDIYDLLVDTVMRTVLLCESYLFKYINDPLQIHNLQAHHFSCVELAHPLSLVFSIEQNDEKLADIRRQVHTFLNLPLDKPYFHKANALKFMPPSHIPYPLVNVHVGIRPSGIRSERSKSSVTKGVYHYYHYMMDGINDDGWGCAYRSLQSIFSWFKLQGYTSREVPNHLEIQECLVSLGDKPSKFKGSKTWIGSTEVSYVLDSMLNVTSCILNVSSGLEMASIGSVIYEHFEAQGVPIMIGGGVLAHTILGIDIDVESGDMKFLILDPHYNENEDLQKIQRKGFVGWKGINFWNPGSFYNLCLPQRPICY